MRSRSLYCRAQDDDDEADDTIIVENILLLHIHFWGPKKKEFELEIQTERSMFNGMFENRIRNGF